MNYAHKEKAKMNYTQCLLEKKSITQLSWIPHKFAVIGKVIRLKDDDGWIVKETYTTLDENTVLANNRDYTKQRDASDI